MVSRAYNQLIRGALLLELEIEGTDSANCEPVMRTGGCPNCAPGLDWKLALPKQEELRINVIDTCHTVLYNVGMRKKLTAVRLKPEQLKRLEKIAVREDLPVSWLIRKAIDEFLKRQK